MADTPFPPPAPSGGSTPIIPTASPAPDKPFWKKWWVIIIAAVLVLGAIGAIAGGGDKGGSTEPATETTTRATPGDTDATDTSAATPVETTEPEATEPPETTATPTLPPSDVVAGAPAGASGSHSSPVPAGSIADLGDGWRLQVLGVMDDGTKAVMDENQFNDPPPTGKRFTLVSVALGYFGFDDPQNAFSTTISAVGAGNAELSADCGVIPGELTSFGEFLSGGVVIGNLCFVTSPSDAAALQLYGQAGFIGDKVFLEAKQPARATPMTAVRGPLDGTASAPLRKGATPVGTAKEIGDGWSVTIASPARDITDAVHQENQFNEPPATGYRFVGFDVVYTYNGDSSSNALDITIQAFGDSNVELSKSCGVVPNEVDSFSDVFPGGQVTGTVCFAVPEADVTSIVVTAYAGFDSDQRVFFATR